MFICLLCGMPIPDGQEDLIPGYVPVPSKGTFLRYQHTDIDACRAALNRIPHDVACLRIWRYGPDPLTQLDELDPCEG